MKLYIQIENGLPINHPAFESNLIEAFGSIPNNWEPFIRVPNPILTDKNLVLESPDSIYRKIEGVWHDVWYTRQKTEEELATERASRISTIKELWANRPYIQNFIAWVFNEETERYEPPVPRPNDGKFYRWHGPSNNWKEAEPFPQDGKQYTFDFDNWVNMEIV